MMKKTFKLLTLGMTGLALSAQVAWADVAPGQAPAPVSAPVSAVPINAVVTPPQAAGITVSTKPIKSEDAELIIDMGIPVVSGMKDKKYQDELNGIIERLAMEDQELAKKNAHDAAELAKKGGFPVRPHELIVKAEVKSNGGPENKDRLSFIVTTYVATGGTGNPRVDTYNVVDLPEAKRLTLEDLWGPDYKTILNAAIKEQINAHPENYFPEDFKGISDTQGFFVEGNEGVIVFPKYAIAPGVTGNPKFRVPLPADTAGEPKAEPALLLQASETYVNDNGTTMIPLRLVSEALGFQVTWQEATRSADIQKGAQFTTVREGKDAYFLNKMAERSLNGAATNRDGSLYVPLAFVTDILQAKAELQTQGDIVVRP